MLEDIMDKSLQPRFGAALRRTRIRLELTQEQVAHAVGFVTAVYGRIERGYMMPSVPKLRDLCLYLGVSADKLLSLPPPEGPPPPPAAPAKPPANEKDAVADAAELRRLLILIRDLPPDRLRLLGVAAEALAEPDEE